MARLISFSGVARRALFALFAVVGGLGGCAEPEYRIDNCDVECDSACPNGFTCRDGFCVDPAYDGVCAAPLTVRGPKQVDQFVCEPFRVTLTAEGGAGRFDWHVTTGDGGEPASAILVEHKGKTLTLSAPENAFDADQHVSLSLHVEDEHAGSASEELDVYLRRCTVAHAPVLMPLCEGDEVEIPLSAEGGFDNYSWTLAGQLPSGLRLEGDEIVGTVDDESAGTYTLTAQVEDTEKTAGDDAKVLQAETSFSLDVRDCVRIMEPPSALPLCAGDDSDIALSASGGSPPYRWSASDLPSGLEFDVDTGRISGNTRVVGDHSITINVEDSEGQKAPAAKLALDVAACPAIRTKELNACVGTELTVRLDAEPDDKTLEWKKLDGPEGLELTAAGDVRWLPMEPFEGTLELQLSDGNATRVGSIPAIAAAADSAGCNVFGLVTESLPDACSEQYYEYQLTAQGGEGAYYWQQGSSWPSWLTLDPDSGVLSGVAPRGDDLTYSLKVSVTSGSSQLQTKRYDLRARGACKYGFIGRTDDGDHLFLADVRRESAAKPKDLASDLDADTDVVDFEFAPDGRRAAFTARAQVQGTDSDRVRVVPSVDATGVSVASYPASDAEPMTILGIAWSWNGSQLAILHTPLTATGTSAGEGDAGSVAPATELTVLDLHQDPPTARSTLVDLAPQPYLSWLGDEICYLGVLDREIEGQPTNDPAFTCHTVDGDELGSPTTAFAVDPSRFGDYSTVSVARREDKFVLFEAGYGPLVYFAGSDLSPIDVGYATPSPDLSQAARVGETWYDEAETDLVRFPIVADGDFQGPALGPEWVLPNCEVVIAWQDQGRALACSSGGQLQIATFDADGAVLARHDVADAGNLEGQDVAASFAIDSSAFSFDAPDGVRLVTLGEETWSAINVLEHDEGSGFSTLLPVSGAGFVYHVADSVTLITEDAKLVLSGTSKLDPPLPCGHDFVGVGPTTWCGNALRDSRTIAVARGKGVVFRDRGGILYSVDLGAAELSPDTAAIPVGSAKVYCAQSGCSSQIKSSP
jgi:hypothetical protein